MVKGQDVVVLLALLGREDFAVRAIADAVGGDVAGVHRSLKRLAEVGLYEQARSRLSTSRAEEFLLHALSFVCPPHLGPVTRGVPTSWAAPPLAALFADTDELPPVWPDPHGGVRGSGFEPLHATALSAARRDEAMYERLALADALRGGDSRTRNLAAELMKERLWQ